MSGMTPEYDELDALYLYSRQVVLELTRSLAAIVEDPDIPNDLLRDEDFEALEGGREFLSATERHG